MPASHYSNVNPMLRYLKNLECRPKTIMDLGCGKGNLGFSIRSAYPEIIMLGVDIFPKNVNLTANRVLGNGFPVYKSVRQADIRDLMDRDTADLFMAFDVLEHVRREESLKIINHYKGKLIVSVPIGEYPQGPIGGNENERHVDTWELSDVNAVASKVLFVGKVLSVFLC